MAPLSPKIQTALDELGPKFLLCHGQNLFRIVEKKIKKCHILTIFPVLGKLTHINKYLFLQISSCSTSESMDPGCDLIKFFVKVYLFGLQTAELKRSRGTAFELKDDKKSPFRIFFNMTNKHSDFFWAPFSILRFVMELLYFLALFSRPFTESL